MHAGFNAELTDNGQAVDSVASYSLGWDSFATKTCLPSHHSPVVDKVGKTEFPVDDAEDNEEDENDIDDASMYCIVCCHSYSKILF